MRARRAITVCQNTSVSVAVGGSDDDDDDDGACGVTTEADIDAEIQRLKEQS